ncbi:MAG: DUF4145 domain-containing protein [Cyanobacteria bacterium SZAS LIN-3]|nr:DUF4145 domain-containing protein [Cyanobacteria bacterium SZAS LIN-3]
MLDNLDGFIKALDLQMKSALNLQQVAVAAPKPEDEQLYCPKCSGFRRMKIIALHPHGIASRVWKQRNQSQLRNIPAFEIQPIENEQPSMFCLSCTQCDDRFTALIYVGPKGAELAIFSVSAGGLTTRNTDKNVAYFLDQAYKCQGGGAITGAIVMYRAALEQLLTQQGYPTKNLANKIKSLEEDIKNGYGSGHKWVHEIDVGFLKVIKDLGNESIHVNSGDTDTLAIIDAKLLAEVQVLFIELLDLVYEKPGQRAERLKMLQDAHSQVKP